MIPFIGFTPDLDSMTPGAIIDCTNVVPTLRGMAGAPTPVDIGIDALAAACNGAAVLSRLDQQRRLFAGTQTKLYELVGTAYIDRSRVVLLATPGIATGTGSTTGGSLAAATYFVKIVAVDANGFTTPAGVESVGVTTTGATSSIAYTWTAVSGATSYRIYFGTVSGTQASYQTSTVASYTLTSTAGTAGTPPTSGVIPYTGSAETRWRFAQFGNASIATNLTQQMQVSTSGSFADIAQAPKAAIVETAAGFVLAFNLDAAYVGGGRPDAWACSNIYDHLTWTPSSGVNQAQFGYLLNTPGDVRAAKRIGNDVAVYKERSMYLGRYVGPPVIWAFDLVAANAGAVCQEAVIDTGTAHLFIGRDDFWIFDGSRPRPLNAPLKEWFFANSDSKYRYRIRSYFDQFKNLAWWFYPTPGSGGALTDAIVYNLNNDRWGKVSLPIDAVLMYQGSDTIYDDWPPGTAGTFDDIADLPFDSPAFDTEASAMGIIGTDGKIKTMIGPNVDSSITTGDLGDDVQFTTMTQIAPHFTRRPPASSMTHYTRNYVGDVLEDRGTSTLNQNRYDTLASGRQHRMRLVMSGDYEIVGFEPTAVADGAE